MKCINCGTEFTPAKQTAKFCCSKCRSLYWKKTQVPPPKKNYDDLSFEELKVEFTLKMIEAKSIIKTFERLFNDFDVWQDDVARIETLLNNNKEKDELSKLFFDD